MQLVKELIGKSDAVLKGGDGHLAYEGNGIGRPFLGGISRGIWVIDHKSAMTKVHLIGIKLGHLISNVLTQIF